MNKQLQALKDWMDSPEFDEHLIKFGEKMKIEEDRRQRYIQYIHDNYKDQLDEIIEKLCDKYNSDEYINREQKIGYQPRETLMWTMLTYAKKYGTEFAQEEYAKYAGMFTGEMFYLENWVFEVLYGQGTAISVYKKENLKENKDEEK
jgi:hypothetical protein